MPVVAVIAAVAIDAGAIGAIAAGTLTTLGAITAIGATVGAIGAVTKNKTLSMIGMGLGLVGGIGTLAQSAGLFESSASLFGSSASTADAATAAGAEAFSGTAAETFGDAAGTAGATGAASAADLVSAAGDLNGAALDPVGAINATSIAPATGNAASIVTGGAEGSPLAQALSPSATPATLMGGPAADTVGATGVTGATSAADTAAGAAAFSGTGMAAPPQPGMFGRLMDWAHNNQTLAMGVLKAGGSFISGLTNPLTPAQIDALNAQADANRAAAALLTRQAANVGQPLPTISGAPVQSAPVTGVPGGSLINNRPVSAPLITGTPAGSLLGAPA